jgi:hypothetical protein
MGCQEMERVGESIRFGERILKKGFSVSGIINFDFLLITYIEANEKGAAVGVQSSQLANGVILIRHRH